MPTIYLSKWRDADRVNVLGYTSGQREEIGLFESFCEKNIDLDDSRNSIKFISVRTYRSSSISIALAEPIAGSLSRKFTHLPLPMYWLQQAFVFKQ